MADPIDDILSNRSGQEGFQNTLANIANVLASIPQLRARREQQQDLNEYRREQIDIRQQQNAMRQQEIVAKQRAAQMDQRVNQIVSESMTEGPDGEMVIDTAKVAKGLSGVPTERTAAILKSIEDVNGSTAKFAQARREHAADVLNEVAKHPSKDSALLAIAYGKANRWLTEKEIAPFYQMLESGQDIKGYAEQMRDMLSTRYHAKPADNVVVPSGGTLVNKETGAELFKAPVKPATVNVGSFEDYAVRYAQSKGKTPEQLTPADIEDARKRYQQADDRPRITVNTGNADDVKETVRGMKDGTLPPIMPGRATKEYNALMAEAHRQGFDLSKAATDWAATQKHIASMNGAQQLRLNQAVNQLPELLDSVDALAAKWKGGRFPILNRANLAAAKNGVYGEEVASVARRLDTQIADVVGDLGAVYMGGNSPTDHSLKLAEKALSGDWSEKVLRDMVAQARANVQTRKNSIANTGVQGASGSNPYAPPPTAAAPQWRYNPATQKREPY